MGVKGTIKTILALLTAGGVTAGAVFHKEIKNFITKNSDKEVIDNLTEKSSFDELREVMETEYGKSFVDSMEAMIEASENSHNERFQGLSSLKSDVENADEISKLDLNTPNDFGLTGENALTKNDKKNLTTEISKSMLDALYSDVSECAQETFTGNYINVDNEMSNGDNKQTVIDLKKCESYSQSTYVEDGVKYKECSIINADDSSFARKTTINTEYLVGDNDILHEDLESALNGAGEAVVEDIRYNLELASSYSEDMKLAELSFSSDTYTITKSDSENSSFTIKLTIDPEDRMLTGYGVESSIYDGYSHSWVKEKSDISFDNINKYEFEKAKEDVITNYNQIEQKYNEQKTSTAPQSKIIKSRKDDFMGM